MRPHAPPAVPPRRLAAALLLATAVLCSAPARGQEQPPGWTGADIGRPSKPGEHRLDDDVLTVTGAGSGLNASGEDQLHFVSVPAEGDVEVVARLAAFDGGAKAEAGLMLRPADGGPAGPVAGVVFSPRTSGDDPARNVVEVRGRQPGNRYAPVVYGMATPMAPPLWLKLVRVGRNFAAYRSTDGKVWACVHNDNSGPFLAEGPIRAGVYVAGGPGGAATTARFDHVYVGKPRPEVRTSWIGNHFNGDSQGFVSNNATALYVAPDGTCYTNTYWDEAGEAAKIYRDGKIIKPVDQPYGHNNHCYGGTVTGDGEHLYLYTRERGIVRMDAMGTAESARPFEFSVPLVHDEKDRVASVYGMAAGNGELYVSDHKVAGEGQVLVASLDSGKQMPERSFKFTRPGPIAVDRRGELWVVERAALDEEHGGVDVKAPGSVKCYTKDGRFTGRQITDVRNATALCVDPTGDRLLVCENGPAQNVRIYTGIDEKPACTATFGVEGGLWAGGHPGRLRDPASGGDARLYHPNGVGVDRDGNVYVSCSGAGTDLRKYKPDGTLVWQLNGLHFVDSMDFDPDGDGRELYGPFKHYTMDYARTAPGGEWSFTGYNWDPWRHGPAPRDAISAEVRRLGDRRSLVMYASAQGSAGICRIYRYEGEIAVPCGRIEPHREGNGVPFNKFKLWYDADGDGKESPDEVSFAPRPGGDFTSFDVDSRGDVWVVLHDSNDPHLRRWTCKGIDARGAPIYGTAAGDYEDVPYPAPIGPSPGAVARVRVDRERDVLYLYGPNADREESKTHPWLLARYDRWGEGNRKATYAIRMPTPATDLNFIVQPPLPAYLNFTYQAFDVAGDYIFAAELTGPVHVFAAATGERVTVLNPGPEVSGFAWQDAHAGLHAFKRSDGEYVIVTQNSGFRARNNLLRWRPPTDGTAAPTSAPQPAGKRDAGD